MVEKTCDDYGSDASLSSPTKDRRNRVTSMTDFSFVIEQMREALPDVAGLIEMSGHALGAPSDRKRQTVEDRA